jgi:ATP-dependent RNA helicase HelY
VTNPADSYAAFRRRQRTRPLADFEATLPFTLDPYQREACEAVLDGYGVLVAAPTGAGKTVVGTFAIVQALQRGARAFYTTPIKALSNQKYREYLEQFGRERVGLLTGDVSINPRADIVVMTTEVLRNMMYAGSPDLDSLDVVVLDEVHYLADRFRGPVWEEVLIQLPERVQVVSLSATVSNAEEFGEWLRAVRGHVAVVVSETRPVPLWQLVLTREGLVDLYVPGETDDGGPRLNPELASLSPSRRRGALAPGPRGYGHGRRRGQRGSGGGVLRPPPRFAVIETLDRAGLLPAIFFVFSRSGCDQAVEQCREAGLRLTSKAERFEIRDLLDATVAAVPGTDLDALGFPAFRAAAEAGFAPHHAGMLPVFKQAIEIAFQRGLIKAVFATETLALGINMPARTVAMDRLDKWNGSEHAALTPGEYTQLTGRAGRRGIDVEGHGVVVVHRDFDPEVLASLASKRTYPLRSAFRPTYNMAINLIERVGRAQARDVLELSFAQFQADRAVVGLARELRQYDEAIAGYAEAMACDRGDFAEYAALRREIGELEKEASRASAAARAAANRQVLAGLRRGDIVRIGHGKYKGEALLLDTEVAPEGRRNRRVGNAPDGRGREQATEEAAPVELSKLGSDSRQIGSSRSDPSAALHPLALTARGTVRRLAPHDIGSGLVLVAHIHVPKRFTGRDPASRRDMLARVRTAVRTAPAPRRATSLVPASVEARIAQCRAALTAHPCHACPDRETHARWAFRLDRAEAERTRLSERIDKRTSSVARQFDRVCDVLTRRGYIEEVAGRWRATPAGRILARVYAERDILVAEALRAGAWDGLGADDLAGVVTGLVFEAKEGAASSKVPGSMRRAVLATARIAADVAEIEREAGVPPTAPPDAGASASIARWAHGDTLAQVLEDVLTPGDFVRLASQLVDVLDQIADVAPSVALRSTAREALRRVRRGVVAASGP